MTSSSPDPRQAAWSSYWAAGGLHSCVGSFAGNYEGAIGAFWRGQATALAEGARVLDLATGNGALPLLFREARGPRVLRIDAVDLARIAPRWYRPGEHDDVRFHAGVAMEQLPFPDGAFDLVASQFGFEYADRDAALAEMLRVASPGGRIALVMHHAGSVLVDVGRAELAHQRALLAPGGLLDAVAAVLPWFAAARAGRDLSRVAEAARDREAYNTVMRVLGASIAASPAPDLLREARDHAQRLLAAAGPDPAPVLAAVDAWRDALGLAQLRTAELVAHALDATGAGALVAAIRAARPEADVTCEPLAQREGVLGWALQAGPRAG